MQYESYLNVVDALREEICEVSDALWDNPETAYEEVAAAKMLSDALEKHGFTVNRGVAGIPTAFTAVYGQGKPVIGIQAEYDALNGISSYTYRLIIPAVVICLIVLSLNLFGDGLRDAFDPKLNA